MVSATASTLGEIGLVSGAAIAEVAAHKVVVYAQVSSGLSGDGIIGLASRYKADVPLWAETLISVPESSTVAPVLGELLEQLLVTTL